MSGWVTWSQKVQSGADAHQLGLCPANLYVADGQEIDEQHKFDLLAVNLNTGECVMQVGNPYCPGQPLTDYKTGEFITCRFHLPWTVAWDGSPKNLPLTLKNPKTGFSITGEPQESDTSVTVGVTR